MHVRTDMVIIKNLIDIIDKLSLDIFTKGITKKDISGGRVVFSQLDIPLSNACFAIL
jgi:hypothetical protein